MDMIAQHIETEIGRLPAEWKVARFDSIFDVQQGKQVSQKNRTGENQRPFLRTKNVFWGRLDLSELDEMNFTEAEEDRLKLAAGDLLICEGGDIGRTAIWSGELSPCYYQNHLHRARLIDKESDSRFVLYWLWYAFEIGSIYFGRGNVTTIPNLSQSKLRELPLPIPPRDEQRKIAAVLGVVQKAIEEQERLIALTTELKKTLLHQLFTRGLRGEPQKETEIGLVPESWSVVELGAVANLFGGYAFKSDDVVELSNTQLLRMGNLFQNQLDLSRGPVFYPDEYAKRYDRFVLKEGDLVMSLTGTSGKEDYGYTIELPKLPVTLLLNQRVARIDLIHEGIRKDCLFYFLLSRKFLDHLFPTAKGMKQANLSTYTMKRLRVVIPSLNEQMEIVRILRCVDQRTAHASKKSQVLYSLFMTLLGQLMMGRIRVNSFHGQGVEGSAEDHADASTGH